MLLHRVLALLDEFLELGATSLLLVQLALEALIDSSQRLRSLLLLITTRITVFIFLGHVVNELQGVEQNVFLAFEEFLICSVVCFSITLDLFYLSDMYPLLQNAQTLL